MTEQVDMLLLELEERMEKAIDGLVREFVSIRTGRANPAILDSIQVEYYGVLTPVKQISSISVVEGTQLYIKPFDKSALKGVEQAIYASDLGINPSNDGVGIRLVFPSLTEERRKELTREVDKLGENQKVQIRNIRRDGNDQVKKFELPEDSEKDYLEQVQDLTDKYVKKVDEEVKVKSDEIMTI